jgi:RNA polymerase-binding transcription factor DksA
MPLPQTFLILHGVKIYTILPFLVIGFVIYSFCFWHFGKKEGFDEERLFDLIFLSLLVFLFSLKIDFLIVIISSITLVFCLSLYWKWSVFRILDIFALAIFAGFAVPVFGFVLMGGKFIQLLLIPALLISFLFFSKIRNTKVKSGYVFSILLLISAALGFAYTNGKKYLLFCGLFFIISLVNLYFREKRSMEKTNLPANIYNSLKNKLLVKRKMLKVEQKVLLQEDPYKDFDATADSSENTDEAILEDAKKENTDIMTAAVNVMQLQVRKALAKMKLGKYGVCEVCGKPIDKARLEAYPAATTCMEHAPRS